MGVPFGQRVEFLAQFLGQVDAFTACLVDLLLGLLGIPKTGMQMS